MMKTMFALIVDTMNHDPLCHGGDPSWTECVTCELINRVREDMLRWPKIAEVYMKGRDAGYKQGYEDATSQYKKLYELSKRNKRKMGPGEVEYRRV
jgi:hypothetical protein